MALVIRKATAADAAGWLELVKGTLGSDPVARQVYDLDRVVSQLTGPKVEETWVGEADGKLVGSISILGTGTLNTNPVANLGRYLAAPGSYQNGAAEALLRGMNKLCDEREQLAVLRVPASDNDQQLLLEKVGYVCVGFQPLKHLCMVREGILFYVRIGAPLAVARLPLSQPLPQITELASAVLKNLQLPDPGTLHDGVTGYPLQTDLSIEESTPENYDLCRLEAQSRNPPVEISGQFNWGQGVLRVEADTPIRVLLGQRHLNVVAGLAYYCDEQDRCVRLVDSFATDDLSAAALLQRAVRLAQEQFNAVYVEVDFLIDAPRALKSAEQLGFVPVAFLPGFYDRNGRGVDVVKMVKLNAIYSQENARLTPQARRIVEIVDRNFQDQKVGVAVINLLRGLAMFDGLGDGELGKMARLFTQKLYRPGERVFDKGDSSNEAYVVMRGRVDICLEENAEPVASIGSGAILGEQAFLDGAARNALAVVAQPTILLVIQRAAFNVLVQSEPHLGMVVMRNLALEVSNKLRKADAALSVVSKPTVLAG